MSPRWYVLVFVVFILVTVALWGYLGSIEDDYVPPAGRRTGFLDDPTFVEIPVEEPQAIEVGKRTDRAGPPTVQETTASWTVLANLLDRLAVSLDDAAVRLRSNLWGRPITHLVAGAFDVQAGRYEDALEHYDDALSNDPGEPTILSAKAASLVALHRFNAAVDCYARVIERAPRSVIARYNYGVLLYRQARFSEAAEQFRALVRIQPDHARGQYNLASLAQRARRLSEARDAWRAFTRLRPDVASGWFNLGIVLMDFNDPDEAATCFSRALELDATVPDFYINLGLAYLAGGEDELALQMMRAADDVSPCDPIVLRQLVDVHERLAERDDADSDDHLAQARLLRNQVEMLRDELLDPHYVVRSRDDFEP